VNMGKSCPFHYNVSIKPYLLDTFLEHVHDVDTFSQALTSDLRVLCPQAALRNPSLKPYKPAGPEPCHRGWIREK
jgi:hypothetical protein